MDDFRTRCEAAEAVFIEFEQHGEVFLASGKSNVSLSEIRSLYHTAEEYYQRVNILANNLALEHADRVKGKDHVDWNREEVEDNEAFRSLLAKNSRLMVTLQKTYQPWAAKE